MTENYSMALAEVDMILQYTDTDLVNQLPDKFRNFIENKKSDSYIPKIMTEISLDAQELLPETKAIIALMYKKYWCLTEKEVKDCVEEVSEEFVPDNKDSSADEKFDSVVALETIKELSFIEKIKMFLKSIFNKRGRSEMR